MPVLAPDAPPPTGPRTTRPGPATRSCSACCGTAGSPGSASRRSTAGSGLTIEHQHAFTEESLPYEMPLHLNVPHFSILGATLVDFGTDEQKAEHLPPMLTGEQQWVQFLSEPTGGSDLAGCAHPRRPRRRRVGDERLEDLEHRARCRRRTRCASPAPTGTSPKHRGLTMFIMEIHQPGVQVDPIKQVNGSLEFCQEFFDDVRLPPDSVVGDVNDGWTVAARPARARAQRGRRRFALRERPQLPRRRCRRRVRRQLREARHHAWHVPTTRWRASSSPRRTCSTSCSAGWCSASASAWRRARSSASRRRSPSFHRRRRPNARPRSGSSSRAPTRSRGRSAPRPWDAGVGEDFLERQATSLAGGSNEIQRNLIAERVLGHAPRVGRRPRHPVQGRAQQRDAHFAVGSLTHDQHRGPHDRPRRSRRSAPECRRVR